MSLLRAAHRLRIVQLQRTPAWQSVRWQQIRYRSSRPMNTVILFVPQQEAWVIERMGKYTRILEPGLNVLIPFIETIKYVQSLKEIAIEIPQQSAITVDNVTLDIDGVLYLRVFDAYKASYGVEDPEYAITQLAQTTMRSEVGKITLDTVFRERELLNTAIVEAVNKAADAWGIVCLRYEIREMRMPSRIQEAMQMQVEAERKKRAYILESEGVRVAEVNVAEGKKQSLILNSEGQKLQQINLAAGEANAIFAKAEARARSIRAIANALGEKDGSNAASLSVAEQYVNAFSNIAKQSNTILLPSNVGDASSMVAQALAIYKNLNQQIPESETTAENDHPQKTQEGGSKDQHTTS
ncbi:PREDICTED: stomatin-like protein 2, mitochondrial [Priapulus caudatus]|uniref:Stomatin-like protein 2, mitochondrial n=1 Tax=Priapulus caudatus TaxID=37621 RepID=A0ABM1DVY7_PRICU|nr:PREDICTED: stomatin-like protein 2, mitochondrial [Priapulus caudatus]